MTIKKYAKKSAFVVICLFMIEFNATAQEGQIVREIVYSPSLEGNLLGDSPDRQVNIYLPPSYEIQPERYYPVVYLLHGFTGTQNYFTSRFGNILNAMASWLAQGRVKEMIIVMPNSYNKFRGSFYSNSSTAGNWADYISKDLVEYIDSHYRTLSHRGSRAVIGHSMGGDGAIKLGILFPDIFGCMGGLAGAYMIEDLELQAKASYYAFDSTVENWNQWSSLSFLHQAYFAWASALAPNPDRPPFYCDFPYVYTNTIPREVIKVQEVYDRFLEHDVMRLTEKHSDALLSMRAIYIDCGINDDFNFIENARRLHDKWERFGIEHFYKEFLGNHTNRVMDSTGDALEVISSAIAFDRVSDEFPTNPVPVDGSIYTTDTWMNLRWSPATATVSHDVYFGDTFGDVNDGVHSTFRGNQILTYFTVGLPGSPYPDGLIPGTTYYWRVVEINDTEPNSPWKGPVWSFTLEPNLLALWKLDETEGNIAQDTAVGYYGTCFGGPLWQPDNGKKGGALLLDGIDDYIRTPFILNPEDGSFSAFAWIKGGLPGQVIISQRGDFGETWLSIDPAEGKLMTGFSEMYFGALVSETVITDGQWHHVGFIYDMGSFHRLLYADGVLVAEDATVVSGIPSDSGMHIGASKDLEAGTFFSGLIDDVRIYDTVLSVEEIEELAR